MTEGQRIFKALSRTSDSSPLGYHPEYRYRIECFEETRKLYQARFRQRLTAEVPQWARDLLTTPQHWGAWYSHITPAWWLASETTVDGPRGRPKFQIGTRGGAHQLLATFPGHVMARGGRGKSTNLIAINAGGVFDPDLRFRLSPFLIGDLQLNNSAMFVYEEHRH